MISAFANTWRVPELRDRILFTLAMVVIVRLGVAVTIPGVDASVIKEWLDLRVNEATITLEKHDAPTPFPDKIATGEGPVTLFDPGHPLLWRVA